MNNTLMRFFEHLLLLNLHFTVTSGCIQGCIDTARQVCLAFARRRAKIPERNAPIRKSLRSVFRSGPMRAAGVYHSNAVIGF
jgi:hypothetical protein